MVQRLSLLAIFILLLAACAPSVTPTSAPETQAVARQPTNTPSPTPVTPTNTPSPEPTNTSLPTTIPLPELTETPLPDPTATLAPTATSPPTSTPEIIDCDGTLTPAQGEGPFYTPNTPERTSLIEAGMGGTPLVVTGKVLNENCQPIAGAMLDFWQTDDMGEYDNVGFRMRGHQFSDENGNYRLETILPSRYPGRTPHLHVKVFAADGREVLTSQIYFPGVSDQIADNIFRPDLLAQNLAPDSEGRLRMAFDFVVSN